MYFDDFLCISVVNVLDVYWGIGPMYIGGLVHKLSHIPASEVVMCESIGIRHRSAGHLAQE